MSHLLEQSLPAGAPPAVDAAVEALDGALIRDLRHLRVAALSFESVTLAGGRHVVAVAIDEGGERHWLGVRRVSGRPATAYVGLFSSLMLRGLRADRSLLVHVERCPELGRRIRQAFGPLATFDETA